MSGWPVAWCHRWACRRLLAVAALDDARVDAERLVVAALAALEAPHIRLLHLLAGAPPVRIMQGHEVRSLGWSREEIADRLPGLAEVLDPLVVALTGTALIENVGTVAGPGTITALRSSHETLRLWDGDALRAAVSAASQRRQGQLDRPGRLRVAGRG